MKLATFENMELGNLIFGHSRGIYHVEPRNDYQDAFALFLRAGGFDMYGHTYREDIQDNLSKEDGAFENEIFVIRPYYWGDNEEIMNRPNFVHKPSGLVMTWYKYPMRDAYSNKDISVEDFKEILDDCLKSING